VTYADAIGYGSKMFIVTLRVLGKLFLVLHYSSAAPTYYYTSSPS
jgi:hypothetical protein